MAHQADEDNAKSIHESSDEAEEPEEDFHDDSAQVQLPASAFPYRKDLLYGTDHKAKHPFDHSNQLIEFVVSTFVCMGLHFYWTASNLTVTNSSCSL